MRRRSRRASGRSCGVSCSPTKPTPEESLERGQYVFVQALIREVAYNTLARKDRKARHLAAARYFEQVGSDELAGVLAGHYLAAHANATEGPEADALAAQARVGLKGAAERAASLGAHDQAVALLEQALAVTTDAADEADLLEQAGLSAGKAARYDAAGDFLRRAIAIHRTRDDRLGAARATASLGRTLRWAHRTGAAIEFLLPASAEFTDLFPDPAVLALSSVLAEAYTENHEPRQGLEVAERVLEAAEHGDLAEILAGTLVAKGTALGQLGRRREGIGVVRAAERLARDNGLDDTLMLALGIRGFLQSDLDMATCSSDANREALAVAHRIGNRAGLLRIVNNIGYTAFLTGDWDGAMEQLDGQLAEDLDRGHRISLLGNATIVHACRGEDVTRSLEELQRLLDDDPASGPDFRDFADDAIANAAIADGRLNEARAAWRHLADHAAGNAPEFRYRTARLALWDGEVAEARGTWRRWMQRGSTAP